MCVCSELVGELCVVSHELSFAIMVREAVVYRAHGADVSRVMTTPKDELAGIVKADSLFFRFNSVRELKLPDLGDVLVMRGDTRFVAQKQNVTLGVCSMPVLKFAADHLL